MNGPRVSRIDEPPSSSTRDGEDPGLPFVSTEATADVGFDDLMRRVRPANLDAPKQSFEGRTFASGRIRVGRKLGGGAMGTVYEALDQGRPVAVKTLNLVQPAQVYRLKTEFRRLTGLVHPHVVCVYELFQEDEHWFFTMERVAGLPLHRHLELRPQRVPGQPVLLTGEHRLRALLRQLVEGVAAIHTSGLVHRDLKPSNVVAREDDHLVIIDFGLVSEQVLGGVGQTIDNRVSGTVGYMSPEQLRGAPAAPPSDWYAVGAMLYQMLTGRLPREGGGVFEPVSPARLVPDVPPDLETLCMRLLSHDPWARPTTDEMLVASRAWPARPSTTRAPLSVAPSAEPPFVGRNEELAQLHATFAEAQKRETRVVSVRGGSGTGKTALLRHAVADWRTQGAVVLEGRCSEWESLPYKGLDGVIDSLTRMLLRAPEEQVAQIVPRHVVAVTRVFPSLLRVDAFRDATALRPETTHDEVLLRKLAFAGVKDMLYRLSEQHPLVLAIDDVQWADTDSLLLLGELLSPPDPPPLMLVMAVRSGETTGALESALAELKVRPREIELRELTPEDARSAALKLLSAERADDRTLVDYVVRESQGLPVFISELVRYLNETRELGELPSLRELIRVRMGELPALSCELLELIGLSVRPVTVAVAQAAVSGDVQGMLRQLLSLRLVRSVALSSDTGFTAYTEDVQKAVRSAMPEERVRARHLAIVRALEALDANEPEWLLAHYRALRDHPAVRRCAVLAAERALSLLAFEHAAHMYLVALEHTSEHAPDWIQLNLSCAEALAKAGRGAEAARAYMRAAKSANQEQAVALRSRAVAQWIRCGHLNEGVSLLRETLGVVGIGWPEGKISAIASLLLHRAQIRLRGLEFTLRDEVDAPRELLRKLDALHPAQTALGTFDYLRGATFASQALPIALEAGEPRRLVTALATEAVYGVMLDGSEGSVRAERVQRAIKEARKRAQGPYERAVAQMVHAMCAYWSGRWQTVIAPADQAETLLRDEVPGASWESSLIRSVRHTVALHMGHLGALANEVPVGLSAARERDDRYTHLDLLRRSVVLHLMQDHVGEALSVLSELFALRERYPFLALDHLIMSSVVSVQLYRGDARGARIELERRWAECERMGMQRLPLVRVTVLAMQAECDLLDERISQATKARTLRKLASRVQHEPIAWAPGLFNFLSGCAEALVGDPSSAVLYLRRAIDVFDAHGLASAAASARARVVDLVGEDEQPELAREMQSFFAGAGIASPQAWQRMTLSLY